MKVVHVITGLGIGGAEQQLRLLLRHLPPERATCHVVTLTNPGPVADGIRSDGTGVTHLGMAGNRDLRAVPRLARLIRSGDSTWCTPTSTAPACTAGSPPAWRA